jgi:hypothetical protein
MRALVFILSVKATTLAIVENAPELQPTGLSLFKVELALLFCFVWSLSYRPQPAQRNELNGLRKIGSWSAACLLPAAGCVAVIIGDRGFGGPLFWPAFVGLSWMLGFTVATLYFVLRRAKPKT